jgi:predicted nucleotidyltransferase
MNDRISSDPIVSSFRTALAETYGDRVERAVLFGSRARGDARPDSGYDVAVFIREPDRSFGDVIRLVELGTDILMDTGAVISARPFRAGACNEPMPPMQEIQREDFDL